MIISKSKFGKYCMAKVDLGSENFQRLSSLPGYKKWIGRDLMFDPTGANIDIIRKHWPDAKWSEDTQPILNKYIESLKEAQETLKYKEQELPTNDDFKFKTKPFEHQRRAFYMSRDKENFALLMEQGTGKTKVIIDNAAYLYANNKINTLIVIAPNGVHRNWISNEIPAHMPEWCPSKMMYYQSSISKTKLEKSFNDVYTSENCLKIFAFNVEAFVSKKAVDLITKILLSTQSMIIVDESSRIKTPGAKRTKLITKFGKFAKYRRILTGTPITKGPVDVYSQFRFLNSNILGYDSFYSFKARYCIMGGFENRQIVSYQNIDELTKKMEGHSYRVLKKDCLDLPPKIYQRYYVDLSPKQRKLYDGLKKNFITELEGSSLSAPEAITRLLRLQQIICGWFPLEDKVEQIDDVNPRLLALKDILSDINGKVIIWARFKADLRAIQKTLGDLAVSYTGEVSNEARAIAVQRFQNDDSVKYFIGQPQSGGIGLTLTAAQYAIYYSNDFNLETRLQSEDRCHRIGTKSKVTYIDIESPKTIDTKIIKALRDKKNLADYVNQDPVSLFLTEKES
mgnify:CR=1 FL=1